MYDVIEHTVIWRGENGPKHWNNLLANEGAPYRFVGRKLVPVTNEQELDAVKDALSSSDRYVGVRTHIAGATQALARRPDPDVRNCIKESILAVESAVKVTSGTKSGAFEPAFREFQGKYGALHPAVSAAMSKLYGYSSDEQGLRHAILDDPDRVGVAEARLLLVTCSAFANFLLAKAENLP